MPTPTPIRERPYNIFLSHSSQDKEGFVDGLELWLRQQAGLKVWYDRGLGSGGVSANLQGAINSCKAAVVVLSEHSIQSGWVQSECNSLVDQANQWNGDFRIATVRLDGVEAPGLLKPYKHIDVRGGWSVGAAALLLDSLYAGQERAARNAVYLSRGWRPEEQPFETNICSALQRYRLKVVCDWKDQPEYKVDRIQELIEATGGLVAVVPHRGSGSTSKYFASEIKLARAAGIPQLIFVHSAVDIADEWLDLDPIRFDDTMAQQGADVIEKSFGNRIEAFAQSWKEPPHGGYIFLGHSLDTSVSANFASARNMLSRVTGLPIEVGGLVSAQHVQAAIIKMIKGAEFCIIDLTTSSEYPDLPEKINFALNSSIEAGIALGAGTRLHLTCRGTRRSPPFMFHDAQIWYYEDDLELVGKLYQIAALHRRMVL